MKAVFCNEYGPPEILKFAETSKPIPAPNQILIKAVASSVTAGDWRVRSLEMPSGFQLIAPLVLGFKGPRQPILGTELAGIIEEIGYDVSKFKIGDQVMVFTGGAMGCHAQYKCMQEDGMVVQKPSNLSYEEAATISFGAMTSLDFFKRANIKSTDKILINGASGGVGTSAIQIAKYYGCHVTGVCSTDNIDLVKSLGADAVIDYKSHDFTQNGEFYDIIMDTVGNVPYSKCKHSLHNKGRLLQVCAGLVDLLIIPWLHWTTNHIIIAGPGSESKVYLQEIADLAQSGVLKSVIGRTYPFDSIIEAHRYVDTGHKKGNVAITF